MASTPCFCYYFHEAQSLFLNFVAFVKENLINFFFRLNSRHPKKRQNVKDNKKQQFIRKQLLIVPLLEEDL